MRRGVGVGVGVGVGDAVPAGRLDGSDGVALQVAGQLQAHPVHEGGHVLGEVRQVPVQELGDRQPCCPARRRRRDPHRGLQVLPLRRLQLLLHSGRRVHPHLHQRQEAVVTTLSVTGIMPAGSPCVSGQWSVPASQLCRG